MLRGPASHRAIDHQWGAVHSIRSAEDTRDKSATEKPNSAVLLQLWRFAAKQRIRCKCHDKNSQSDPHHLLMTACEKREPHRNTKERGSEQPSRTTHMDVPPVLGNDNSGDGN